MRTSLLLPLGFAWLLAGCSSISVKDNLVTLDPAYFPDQANSSRVEAPASNTKLLAAYWQVTSPPRSMPAGERAPAAEFDVSHPLPSYLAAEPLVQKLVVAAYEAIGEGKKPTVEVTQGDISGLARSLNDTFVVNGADLPVTAQDSGNATNKIVRKYFGAYYADHDNGFINREGTVYKRHEIKNRIGNDVITAMVAIALEALFDSLLDTTVYVDKDGRFQTSDGLEPSAHRYRAAKTEALVERGQPGIDDLELKAIRYLSGLAGDRSKALSGAAYRSFGAVELNFVIGGKFSIGDNETWAKILDTTFEIASKRIVEETARQGFEKMTLTYPKQPRAVADTSEAERLLRDLE